MVSYRNDYVPPSSDIPRDIHLNTPLEEYDINYLLDVKELSSDRVQLRPFIVSLGLRQVTSADLHLALASCPIASRRGPSQSGGVAMVGGQAVPGRQ